MTYLKQLLFVLLISSVAQSQTRVLDSLRKELATTGEDSNRVRLSFQISKKLRARKEFKEALEVAEAAFILAKKINYKKGIALTAGNLAGIHAAESRFPEALDFQFKGLKVWQELNDKPEESSTYLAIGNLFARMKDFEQAKKYMLQAMSVKTEIKDTCGVGHVRLNMANLLFNFKDYKGAITEYSTCYSIIKNCNNNDAAKAVLYDNMGLAYFNLGEYANAEKLQILSMDIRKNYKDKSDLAGSLINLSSTYEKLNKISKAISYAKEGTMLAVEYKHMEWAANGYHQLSDLYKATGDHKSAFENYLEYKKINEEIFNQENSKKAMKAQMQFEYEKKSLADSLQAAEEKKTKELIYQQEITKQRYLTYAGIGAFLVMVLVSFLVFRAFKGKQKAHKEIQIQKTLVELKQKEILDSIHYAKRIQSAFMNSEQVIGKKISSLKKDVK